MIRGRPGGTVEQLLGGPPGDPGRMACPHLMTFSAKSRFFVTPLHVQSCLLGDSSLIGIVGRGGSPGGALVDQAVADGLRDGEDATAPCVLADVAGIAPGRLSDPV